MPRRTDSVSLGPAFILVLAGALACSESGARDARSSGSGAIGGGRAPGVTVVTLSSQDVATATRSSLEESVPITGDLRPIEAVDIRARLEGELVGVYVREGERVSAGQILARFEASEQESARQSAVAARAAAQSAHQTAAWNRDQLAELFKAGAIPERDLRAAEQAVASAGAQVAAAEAQLSSSSSVVSDTRVLAPISGTIERRFVESGEDVARGAQLFTLVRTDVLELAAAVPARNASAVRVGQVARFVADGRRIDGRVMRVSPTIDPATRAISVFIHVANSTGALKGGTFVSGRLIGRTIPSALVVPNAAIRQGEAEQSTYVYEIADELIDQTPVQVGVIDEERALAQVLSGLSEGDRVIVGNVGAVGQGMKVQVIGIRDSGFGIRGSDAPASPARSNRAQ